MTDIRLIPQQGDFSADIALLGADLDTDDGLDTAIIISLFTDARAPDDAELPVEGGDRRGWWGDSYPEAAGDQVGSLLWVLSRSKDAPQTLVDAQTYATAALAWLIEDGVAASVEVTPSVPQTGWLALQITITRPTGPSRLRYDYVWRLS